MNPKKIYGMTTITVLSIASLSAINLQQSPSHAEATTTNAVALSSVSAYW